MVCLEDRFSLSADPYVWSMGDPVLQLLQELERSRSQEGGATHSTRVIGPFLKTLRVTEENDTLI